MILKEKRIGEEGRFNLKVRDRLGNSFTMLVGGNCDLYWVPENHKKVRTFYFDKGNAFYGYLEMLFDAIKKRDDKFNPLLKDNCFTFISEDWHEDIANRLVIEKTEDEYKVDFIRNENEHLWEYPRRGTVICFCNSGSRVPRIEGLFMRLFTYLAYENNEVQTENE